MTWSTTHIPRDNWVVWSKCMITSFVAAGFLTPHPPDPDMLPFSPPPQKKKEKKESYTSDIPWPQLIYCRTRSHLPPQMCPILFGFMLSSEQPHCTNSDGVLSRDLNMTSPTHKSKFFINSEFFVLLTLPILAVVTLSAVHQFFHPRPKLNFWIGIFHRVLVTWLEC